MKIGEARSAYNTYCSRLTERYKELKEQAQKQQAAGNTEQAAATLTLSQDEEELEHTDMAELEEEIPDTELNMKMPEIDTSLLETYE